MVPFRLAILLLNFNFRLLALTPPDAEAPEDCSRRFDDLPCLDDPGSSLRRRRGVVVHLVVDVGVLGI